MCAKNQLIAKPPNHEMNERRGGLQCYKREMGKRREVKKWKLFVHSTTERMASKHSMKPLAIEWIGEGKNI